MPITVLLSQVVFFGWYDAWLRRGSQETPEEMLALFKEDGFLGTFWNGILGK